MTIQPLFRAQDHIFRFYLLFMKIVLQRVKGASVFIDGTQLASIARGYVLFLAIEQSDSKQDIEYLVNKVLDLRLFAKVNSHFDKSVVCCRSGWCVRKSKKFHSNGSRSKILDICLRYPSDKRQTLL